MLSTLVVVMATIEFECGRCREILRAQLVCIFNTCDGMHKKGHNAWGMLMHNRSRPYATTTQQCIYKALISKYLYKFQLFGIFCLGCILIWVHLKLGRQWKVTIFYMFCVKERVHIFNTKNL
jgi:hypothetical protein